MLIYKDILNGDEIISDVYDLKDSTKYPGCWEVDCKMVTVGGEDFVLEGANASAEGEDAGEGIESTGEQVVDIVHAFRLKRLEPKPDKKFAMAEYRKYMKAVVLKMKENGVEADKIKEFQTTALESVKNIQTYWGALDPYGGENYDPSTPSMWVLIDFREDGITPYAIIFKDPLEHYKV